MKKCKFKLNTYIILVDGQTFFTAGLSASSEVKGGSRRIKKLQYQNLELPRAQDLIGAQWGLPEVPKKVQKMIKRQRKRKKLFVKFQFNSWIGCWGYKLKENHIISKLVVRCDIVMQA